MSVKILDLNDPRNRIIVALDNITSLAEVKRLVNLLKDYVGYFKVGFQLIHSLGGPQVVWAIKEAGGKVFYDCKLHDTNDTMTVAAKEIANMGVDIFNLHASAGKKAMKSVKEVSGNSIVAGVTVLTSLSDEECEKIYHSVLIDKVVDFANDVAISGLQAIICSPSETPTIKAIFKSLLTITPGIRPLWAVPNDQNPDRIMTPYKAILAGSDFEVIGRPILKPPPEIGDPITAAVIIAKEINDALLEKEKLS